MQIIVILMLVLSFLQGGEESYTIVAINNAHSVTVKSNQLLNVEYEYYQEVNCYDTFEIGDIVVDVDGDLEVQEVPTYKVIDVIDSEHVKIEDTSGATYEVYQDQDCIINFKVDDQVILVDDLMLVCEDNNTDIVPCYGEHIIKEYPDSLVLYTHEYYCIIPYNVTHDYSIFN